jgi:hypothetical protein
MDFNSVVFNYICRPEEPRHIFSHQQPDWRSRKKSEGSAPVVAKIETEVVRRNMGDAWDSDSDEETTDYSKNTETFGQGRGQGTSIVNFIFLNLTRDLVIKTRGRTKNPIPSSIPSRASDSRTT